LFPPSVKHLLLGPDGTPSEDALRCIASSEEGSEAELLKAAIVVIQEEGETIFVYVSFTR
jgi:hypothetical protein